MTSALVRVRALTITAAAVAQFAFLAVIGWVPPQIAWSQSALYTCQEDGGSADCIDVNQDSPPMIIADAGAGTLGPFHSDQELYNGIQSAGLVDWCSSTTQSDPYTWTFGQFSGNSMYWTTTVDEQIDGGPCGIRYSPGTLHWVSNKFITLSCPQTGGWNQNGVSTPHHPYGYCYRTPPSRCPNCVGDPIDPVTGIETEQEIDYNGVGTNPLRFVRYYSSGAAAVGGSMGTVWSHNYTRTLLFYGGDAVKASRPDGSNRVFVQASGGGYVETGTALDQLIALLDGSGNVIGWRFVDSDDTTESYSTAGQLLSITYRGGQTQTFSYSTSSTPTSVAPYPGLLIGVSDAFGHQLSFAYDSLAELTTMTDPSGATYSYSYTSGMLTTVTYPNSTTRQYLYDESAETEGADLPYALTGIIDEGATRYATIGYNAGGLAISSQLAGGVDQYTLSPANYYGYAATSVTDPLGTSRTYYYTAVANLPRFTQISQPCPYCPDAPANLGFDANGNINSRTDFNGNLTSYIFDPTRNLETSRTEADGSLQARTITTQWDTNWRRPDQMTEPNRSTAYAYDSLGNALTRAVMDTTVSPNVTRTWTYTYDSYGRVLTAKGPRTDVNSTTTYTYYTCTTGAQCGQLHTVTDPVGSITTYNTYNAHGQPLTITDPNGVVTTLTYDVRQRLSSRSTGGDTTAFAYYPTGLLKTVTLPDSSTLTYTYDGAHRLTAIQDSLGNSMQYTLDAMGNRTGESAYDPTSTLDRALSRVYDSLDQLNQLVGAAGTSAVTTTYAYDSNGNQTSIAAPLSRTTGKTFDALNRVAQVSDPNSGQTSFGYDTEDNLTSVTDPNGLSTSYAYNGFGDLSQLVSPDTGTTANTYDSGGNLSTSKDARNDTATYSYDAANRVKQIAYGDQTIAYTYDAGTNGKGRLTGASDANHSMTWHYDALGRVTSKGQTIGSVTKSVSYAYSNGDLTTLTTPSGQAVTYTYSNHQITGISINGTTLLSGVNYEAFGPARGWSWGNGSTETRLYDTDGNPSQMGGVESHSYSIDDTFRITQITNASNSALTWSYGYDPLDRLTSASDTSTSLGWTYDANGNRLTQSAATGTSYVISATNNQITSSTGSQARTYAYDAAGHVLSYGSNTFTYNHRGRMSSAKVGSVTTSYVYNALGQRVKKSGGPAGTVLFMYDEAGHLLGEYSSVGALVEETVYLGDLPVATIRLVGSTATVYYVHADHLATPIMVTQPSSNAVTWRWDQDPFGTAMPNQNPASLGPFVYNQRFPGQYYDQETGLNYNYMRDYDPTVGRYVESDPSGLKGGIDTYAYVDGNPISEVDRRGLSGNGTGWGQYQFHPHPPNASGCNGKCKGSDVLAMHYDNSSCGADIQCQLAMQSAGFVPHTDYYSKSCLWKLGVGGKPAGFAASWGLQRVAPGLASAFGASENTVGLIGLWGSRILSMDMGLAFLPVGIWSMFNECECSGNN